MILALTLALIALQLADSWTTHRVLALGGTETNPVVRAALRFGTAGEVALAVVSVLLAAAVGVLCYYAGIWWPLPIVAAPFVWAVWNNWRNMQPAPQPELRVIREIAVRGAWDHAARYAKAVVSAPNDERRTRCAQLRDAYTALAEAQDELARIEGTS